MARSKQKFDFLSQYIDFSKKNQFVFIDVGGGIGSFANFMNSKGINSITFEPYDKGGMGLKDIHEFIDKSQPKIIYVTMFHVLEHVNDPQNFIKSYIDFFGSIENVEIFFIIECPIIENETKLICDLTPFWAPFHTIHFSLNTFTKILEYSGLITNHYVSFPDYNGLMTINSIKKICNHTTNFDSESLNFEVEFEKASEYKSNYEIGIASMREKLEIELNKFKVVVLFGAGIGLDFFYANFSTLIQNKKVLVLDSDTSRQSINVIDPVKFFRDLLVESTYIVPTSYAKSEDIIKVCKDMIVKYSSHQELVDYYHYPLVRAY